ncbi:TonB-dependent receptor [Sphingopyxis terrae]|uniref:TonB-dependent receptor n=1 Tax=Sphingopyxis terrae TaxID=33052 RepID=UPI003611C85C
MLGAFNSYANGLPPSFLATPFYRNNTDDLKIKSYGIFGETYFEFNDRVKLTLGLRYNHDEKDVIARTSLASFLTPFGQTGTAFDSPYVVTFDADPARPGTSCSRLVRSASTSSPAARFSISRSRRTIWSMRAIRAVTSRAASTRRFRRSSRFRNRSSPNRSMRSKSVRRTPSPMARCSST